MCATPDLEAEVASLALLPTCAHSAPASLPRPTWVPRPHPGRPPGAVVEGLIRGFHPMWRAAGLITVAEPAARASEALQQGANPAISFRRISTAIHSTRRNITSTFLRRTAVLHSSHTGISRYCATVRASQVDENEVTFAGALVRSTRHPHGMRPNSSSQSPRLPLNPLAASTASQATSARSSRDGRSGDCNSTGEERGRLSPWKGQSTPYTKTARSTP